MGTSISQIITVRTPDIAVVPAPPTGLSVSNLASTSLTLNWVASAAGTPPITYQPQYQLSGATSWTVFGSPISILSVDIDHLTPNSLYVFQVLAINATGTTPSTTTTAATSAIVPGAPTGLAVVGSPTQSGVNLQWQAPSVGTTPFTYQVYSASPSGSGSYAAIGAVVSITSASISSLTAATSYDFEVFAKNSAGTGAASAPLINVVTVGSGGQNAPGPAGTPVVSAITSGGLTLTWTAPTTGTAPFTYQAQYGRLGDTSWTNIGGTVPSGLNTILSGLLPSTDYQFQILTTNSFGSSISASVAGTTLADIPSTPGIPAVVGSPTQTSVSLQWSVPATGTLPFTYQVSYQTPSGSGGFVDFSSTTTTPSQVISGLTPGSTYAFRVVARNSAGSSAASPALIGVATAAASSAPGPATGLTVSALATTTLTLTWVAPTTGTPPFTYQPQQALAGGSSWANIGSGIPGVTVNVSFLTPATDYQFQILTTNAIGTSTSAAVPATTLSVLPGTPTALAVSGTIGQNSVPLQWTAPTTGTLPFTYQVYRASPTGSTSFVTAGASTSLPNATASGLIANTSYDFRVVASNAAGSGPNSNLLSNIVTAAIPALVLPSAPQNLVSTGIASDSISISWTAPATGTAPLQYVVQYQGPSAVVPGQVAAPSISALTDVALTLTWVAPTTGTPPFTYQPQVSTDSGSTWASIGASTGSTSANLTGLTASRSYQFNILTTNSVGSSTSASASATTSPTPGTTESPAGTLVSTEGPKINASPTPGTPGTGNLVSIVSAQVAVNSKVIAATSGVTKLYYIGNTCSQYNGTNWYQPVIDGNGGTQLTNPAVPQPTVSLSNATVTAGAAAGTNVGTMSTSVGAGSYAWTYTLFGTDASSFKVSGNSLQTATALTARAYVFTISATPTPAIVGSPFSLPVSVQAQTVATSTYFTVKNGKIYKPDGVTEFVPRGVALQPGDLPNALTNLQGSPLVTTQFKNLNIIRVVVADFNGDKSQATSYAQATAAILTPYVNILTPLKIVLAINDHTTDDPTNPNVGGGLGNNYTVANGKLAPMTNYYISLANAFKGNPYVWFGTRNEPPNNSSGALTIEQKATYDAIRGTGNGTIIEIEQVGGGVPPGYAARPITEGLINGADNPNGLTPTSVYRAMTNIVWGPHDYNWMTNQNNTVDVGLTAQVAAVNAHINACSQLTSADGQVPVVFWEYGVATGTTPDIGGVSLATAVQQSANGSIGWLADPYQAANSMLKTDGSLTPWGQQTANWLAGHPYP